ncbi:hypothetical protein D3C83_129390 [compost metagenome]
MIVSVVALSSEPSGSMNGKSERYFALPNTARRQRLDSMIITPMIIPTTAFRAVFSSFAEKNF